MPQEMVLEWWCEQIHVSQRTYNVKLQPPMPDGAARLQTCCGVHKKTLLTSACNAALNYLSSFSENQKENPAQRFGSGRPRDVLSGYFSVF